MEISEKIVQAQVNHPWKFIAVIFLITAALLPGIAQLPGNVEPSIEKVLPQDLEEIETMNFVRSQYGTDMIYLLVYAEQPVHDVRTPQLLTYMDVLGEKIQTREHVLEVNTLADLVKKENDGNIPGSQDIIERQLKGQPRLNQFANHDYSFAVIRIRSDTGSDADTINQVVEAVETDIVSVESLNPGSGIKMTGFNTIDKATFEFIMSDFAKITLLSLLLVATVVFLTFRSAPGTAFPMLVVMLSLTWTMGIAGYLNLTVTVVTMVAAAMILGLGIDFGIHVTHTYYRLRKDCGPVESLKDTMRELLRAMVGASTTTMAGFLALLFGVLPAMKILAIILALGIFNTLLGAVFMLPVVIYLNERRTIR